MWLLYCCQLAQAATGLPPISFREMPFPVLSAPQAEAVASCLLRNAQDPRSKAAMVPAVLAHG